MVLDTSGLLSDHAGEQMRLATRPLPARSMTQVRGEGVEQVQRTLETQSSR